MARMTREQMLVAAAETMDAMPDASGKADLVGEKGSIIVAPEVTELKAAFKRIKKVDGYRWVMLHREDLFAANTLSLGSKAGMITPDGTVLKNADIPRKKM
jgi:hypothetical protein